MSASFAMGPTLLRPGPVLEWAPMRWLPADANPGAGAHGGARFHPVPPFGERRIGPEEELSRVDRGQVDAAVASGFAEIVVPIRGVERPTGLEVLHPRDVAELELVLGIVGVHGRRHVLDVD